MFRQISVKISNVTSLKINSRTEGVVSDGKTRETYYPLWATVLQRGLNKRQRSHASLWDNKQSPSVLIIDSYDLKFRA